MNRGPFLFAILFAALFLITGTAKAQCTILSYNSLKNLWDNKAKEEKLLEMGFEKRSSHFGRCKIEMCSTNDSISKNYNEFVFVYDDEVMYSFSDKDAYLALKTEVKEKAEYAGFAMFDDVRREYYTDGKICYCFYIGQRSCLSTKIPDYNLGFLEKVPSYVKKE
jgi:hypothetical protein